VAASLNPAQAPMPAPDKVNILLVDDQPSRLLTYRAILDDMHENLIEARSGTEALRLLMTHDFAVILLDVNMPVMDGYETASMIHEHPRFENTPIIFVTAVNVSDLDRMRGYRVGAFDYVTVPIIPEILHSKVTVLVELYRKRRELEIVNRNLTATHQALLEDKARELEALNESLRLANSELEHRNAQLHSEIAERARVEARLVEQDRRKDEFLAMLAHELRNPLASVSNGINAFRLTDTAPYALHDAMSRQVKLLIRLIDDLLDVARIRRGKLTLKKSSTTLYAIVDSAMETITPLLHAGRHELIVERMVDDVVLRVDHERLSQVFSNLLSNAAKYSDKGASIRLTLARSGDALEIAVIDQGIGLSPEQKEWIFDLFAQVDTTLERARGGLGIGLTLSRNIVEMHDGRLSVESDGLGHGSRFIVRLPDSVLAPSAPPPERSTAMPEATCRVLIVDDNADSADSLAMILELLGHPAKSVTDPHEAVDVACDFKPDVVFLDIGMPGMSGYEVARALRAAQALPSVKLVALTGWGQPEDRRRSAEAGFDYHLVKPAELSQIESICNAAAGRAASVPESVGAIVPAQDAGNVEPSVVFQARPNPA
jgi:signal transduction histidine kinase